MLSLAEELQQSNGSCEEIFDHLVKWNDPKVVASLLILACINIVVIVGNCLVILAVFISTKLQTVTNLFIVSLAVADLMVGLAVLPFSATWEIFEIWLFGEIWCSVWLAVDVWMCTASILNLCAISLDRYVAVTRPVSYPSIMSSKKAKILIACVWVLSFIICFPPLVGWNDRKLTFVRQVTNNSSTTTSLGTYTAGDILPADAIVDKCTLSCELTNDKGYVVYSALGSFFLPMFVMMFFYWRIYRAAVETTRAINQGFRTTKGTKLLGTRFEEQRLTLRIHRGRSVQHHHRSGSPKSAVPPYNGRLHSGGSARMSRSRSQERMNPHLTPPTRGKRSSSFKPRTGHSSGRRARAVERTVSGNSAGGSLQYRNDAAVHQPSAETLSIPMEGRRFGNNGVNGGHVSESESPTPSPSPTMCTTVVVGQSSISGNKYETLSSSSTEDVKPKLISKMGKRNIKAQVKRFRMETKAAKTLGIIVGGFILCWLPFFTMYLVRAFCPTCIPSLLFSVSFWLGYCNSALNPCIYALFSKDFRFAFKKIICRCVCQREKKPQPQPVPMFLSSLGDDSEED